MIIVQLTGGLGNQMFSYAAGRALAVARGTEVRLDVTHYAGPQREPELAQFRRAFELQQFQVKAAVATDDDIRRVRDRFRGNLLSRTAAHFLRDWFRRLPCGHFYERSMNYESIFWNLPDNTYLQGYFQSESYFLRSADLIRSEFAVVDQKITAYAREFASQRKGVGKSLCAIHVRRGDIAYSFEKLKNPNLLYGTPLSTDYFSAAMGRFPTGTLFLVFSDDLDWCRDNLKGDRLEFVGGHSALQDFELIRACDHQIISNSTFSWWAAWLNENPQKQVIAPRAWFTPGRFPGQQMDSLIPAQWEMI